MLPSTPTTSNQAAAPQSADGAPTSGQAPVSNVFTQDQYNGLKGNYEHQLKQTRATADEFKGRADALESQYKAAQLEIDALKGKASQAEELSKKIADLDAQHKAAVGMNNRMNTLMKYPALLDEGTLELVKNTTLEGEALEKVLGGLAAKIGNAPPPTSLGQTPPQPNSIAVTPESLRDDATALLRQGKTSEGYAKLSEAARLQDKTLGFQGPPIDRSNNRPPSAGPAGG